ncbi:hypothetical protein IAU60_005619 [Kwoniella sp. DSM 27419]
MSTASSSKPQDGAQADDHREQSQPAQSPQSTLADDPAESPSSQLFSQLYNHPSTSNNPLLPSLPTSTASVLASRYDPSLPYFQNGSSSASSASGSRAPPPPMPEKCFSLCTQSAEARPLCRMLCLRKRTLPPTREEQLRRLRPPSLNAVATSASTTASSGGTTAILASYLSAPFEALRRKVEPYSLVYVRGNPDGVVGRYMEELEWDDGEYDFGTISRGVVNGSAGKKPREEKKYEWMDWGDHGALLHLPLKTIFNPITSIPSTLSSLLTPSYNLLRLYSGSFTDGSQSRALEKFSKEVENGGAIQMLAKLRGYWEKRVQETREKREEMMRERQERVKEVGKEVEGKGE